MKRHNLSYPFLKLAAREHHAPAAGEAADANISARPRHLPFVSTARMDFAQAHTVADVYLEGGVKQWTVAPYIPTAFPLGVASSVIETRY